MTPKMKMVLLPALGLAACASDPAAEQHDPTACGGAGTICTWGGTGLAAFGGGGRAPTQSSLYSPMDVEFAPDGQSYSVDWNNHRIRRVEADGKVRTVIGSELPGDGPPDLSDMKPEGAPALDIELNHPTDLQFLPD